MFYEFGTTPKVEKIERKNKKFVHLLTPMVFQSRSNIKGVNLIIIPVNEISHSSTVGGDGAFYISVYKVQKNHISSIYWTGV